MSRNPNQRTVFSVLYNESDAFLSSYLDNFLAFTGPDEFLFVNLPPGRALMDEAHHAGGERIHIFNGSVTRNKIGHTLLIGHLESFSQAVSVCGESQLFCALASNSLMVRRFNKEATLRELTKKRPARGYDPHDLPDTWWWGRFKKSPDAIRYLRDTWQLKRIWVNQIEGFIAAHADWDTLSARLSTIIEMGRLIDPDYRVPLEEMLPSTAILHFGSGRYTNICHNFWSRQKTSQGKVEIGDLLDLPALYPEHICAMKWFERDAAASETLAVTRPWSCDLFADIVAGTPDGNTNRAHVRRILLGKIAQAIRERERFMPITQAWSFESEKTGSKCSLTAKSLEAVRQRVPVSTGSAHGKERSQAYVVMEKTQHTLKLEIDIEQAATTRLRISCEPAISTDHAAPGDSVVEGYLYMSSLTGPKCSFRVRVLRPVQDHQEAMLRRIVLSQNSEYRIINVWHWEHTDGYCDYYYRNDVFFDEADIWLGFPFFTRSNIDAYVEVLDGSPASIASYSEGTPQNTISDAATKR
jgi:hypothetical protein